MKVNLKKYLLYSSLFAIFSEAFYFRFIIDLKLYYLIILINLIVLFKEKKLLMHKNIVILLFLVLIHAFLNILIFKIPPNLMLSQLIGIFISILYFYNIFKLFDHNYIFESYCKFSYYISLIGYPGYFLGFNLNVNDDSRFCSILSEPAHYAILILPACYYFYRQKKYKETLFILISLFLTESSIAYIGCSLIFILPYLKFKKIIYAFSIIPVILFIFYLVYNNNEKVKMRFDESIESLKVVNNGKFNSSINLSSYALLSNFYIAKENFKDHIFGTGIGSHVFMYNEYYGKSIRAPQYLKIQDLDKINSKDAASLFLRLMSEFGIFGLIIIFSLIIKIYKNYRKENELITQGISIYVLLKLFRDGHYFPPEFYFFILIFYFYKNEKNISYN